MKTKASTKRIKKNDFLGQRLIDILDHAIAYPETIVTAARSHDIAIMRKQLGMTQRAFAEAYGINLETLKQWEQGKRLPDTTSSAYLTCIAKQPELIRQLIR